MASICVASTGHVPPDVLEGFQGHIWRLTSGQNRKCGAQTASRALMAQARPSAGDSTASWSCQPVAGSWASHHHQRSSAASSPSSASGRAASRRGRRRARRRSHSAPKRPAAAPRRRPKAPPLAPAHASQRDAPRPASSSARRAARQPERRAAPGRRRPRRRRPRRGRWSSSSTARRAGARRARRPGRRAARGSPSGRATSPSATGGGGDGNSAPASWYSASAYAGSHAASGVRQLEDVGQPGDRSPASIALAAERPLVGDERGPGAGLEQRRQLGPRVVLGDDLGQRADREAPGALVEHAGRPRRRGQQRQPVLGERRRRPQLAAGADGVAGRVAEPAQPVPVAGRRSSRRRAARARRGRRGGSARRAASSAVAHPAVTRAARGSGRRSRRRAARRARPATPPAAAARRPRPARSARRRRAARHAARASTAATWAGVSASPANSQITVRSLKSGAKHSPLSMRPHAVAGEQAVAALAIGVVGDDVEQGDRPAAGRGGRDAARRS